LNVVRSVYWKWIYPKKEARNQSDSAAFLSPSLFNAERSYSAEADRWLKPKRQPREAAWPQPTSEIGGRAVSLQFSALLLFTHYVCFHLYARQNFCKRKEVG
jgi:hypothetical protein